MQININMHKSKLLVCDIDKAIRYPSFVQCKIASFHLSQYRCHIFFRYGKHARFPVRTINILRDRKSFKRVKDMMGSTLPSSSLHDKPRGSSTENATFGRIARNVFNEGQ